MAYLNSVDVSKDWKRTKADVTCVGLFEDGSLSELGQVMDQDSGGRFRSLIQAGNLTGKSGNADLVVVQDRPVLVVGLGKPEALDRDGIRTAAARCSREAIARKFGSLAVEAFREEESQAVAEGIILGSYQYLDYKTQDEDCFELTSATVIGGQESAVRKGVLVGQSVCFARDLENAPGNETTPTRLAQAAADIARDGGMQLTVFDREEFTQMGMGALAAVASGSGEPPKFIVLEYGSPEDDEKPVVLVGKGLTFDSGGISIKPGAGMDEMKFDMCGAGVVLGVMKALSLLQPKAHVVGIVPSTENLSGAKAYKPGDILKAYNGKTIEVLNTDAEGRLILADALSYASKHFDPAYILDFATLTGAVLIALGHIATGVLGTDAALMEKVKQAARETGEKVWELPLWDEFCEQVKSKIADVKNIGEARQAGTIAGAAFLKEFVGEGIPWVHFDIAGTAWGGKESPLVYQKGATGAGIRLVLNLLGV
ncbi:MAG: leucyl aminopeptidase [Candidatus Neomarinimicrobiota bacterium]|nr:MAG: leucyl aminopeptidase [Candidatus Neomarinimicrobiota bacterium]